MKKFVVLNSKVAFIFMLSVNPIAFSQKENRTQDKQEKTGKIVDVEITKKGFEPNSIKVKAGEKVTLKLTRKTDATCAKIVTVPSQKIKKSLPLNESVLVELGKLSKGEIKFGCSMGMMLSAVIIAE
jgi:plastocyanin domain-containing protein